jgi:hypothetical protein
MNGTVNFTRCERRRHKQRIEAQGNQVAILRGMAREMSPMQAIVFMSYFNQFPELARPGNDNYFSPAWAVTIRTMGIKRRAFWKMTSNLVELGFLDVRPHLFKADEYRIMFDKLAKYTEKGTT